MTKKPYFPQAQPLENLLEITAPDVALLGKARGALGEYEGHLTNLINPALMLSTLIIREAVLSSRIEGTVTEADEVLEQDAANESVSDNDLRQVINYRTALLRVSYLVEEWGLSLHTVRSLHQVLMENVRGEDKNPGEFRKKQNWIGKKGCSIEEATYIPPPPEILLDQLQAFEEFINLKDDALDPLIHTALMHAQFELIHPFIDVFKINNLLEITAPDVALLGKARGALGEYEGHLTNLINPALMLSTLIIREAVLSSRIEGTVTEADEVLEQDAANESVSDNDLRQVINYRTALLRVSYLVEEWGLSLHTVRSLHQVLMENVRGEDKNPGEFRKKQNWIGKKGCSIEEATYIPPPPEILLDQLQAFEEFINLKDDALDPLIHTALMHAQFELIHPFIDGNGRVGRLLIPVLLKSRDVLSHPFFYISEYLEQNDEEYKARLFAISENDDWGGWIKFFLQAVEQQAKTNTERIKEIS